ncbi:DUF4392 domain-containing protein [Cytobacillus sp. FSL K6-0129]|uniref:DUF4392 domain-containing protein n=1 Tax=Cytobacillus sp. FSL K6-0129 TaxID=2921421 RepID=UPI0030F88604
MYDRLDQIVNIDYNKRSIHHLYDASRALVKIPLTEKAAEIIQELPENRFVFFSTGSVTRSWVTPTIGETDGPPGTAILARVIREYRGAIPIILTEESLVKATIPILKAAGLAVVTPEQALAAQQYHEKGYTSVACILPFPTEDHEADEVSSQLINQFNPAAVISIEKAGKGEKGTYHNMRGHDYSSGRARIDYLINKAMDNNIPTIAIGDGGNEIGMGNVLEAVEEFVPHGKTIASVTKVDLLLTASVSNWGCYAVCAALALKNKNLNYLHNEADERRMLDAAILSGHVDGATGKAEATVDGFPLSTNIAIIEMLNSVVKKEV